MAAGKPGRAPLPHARVALVKLFLAHGLPTRQIVRECKGRGEPVSFTTVKRIATGKHLAAVESTSRLAPGETQLKVPTRCPGCGCLVTVLPCRSPECVRARASEQAPTLAGLRNQVAQLPERARRARVRAPRRRRGVAPPETILAFQLLPEDVERYEQMKDRFERDPGSGPGD